MFNRIVVGTDGSPEGKDAVALGAAIADATGAGLTLLSAYSPFLISAGEGMNRKSQIRAAERELWAERRHFAPYAHVEVVADSDPARALLLNARRWHADLVVIGSTRRAADGRCAIGQVGRRLLSRMPPALAIAKRGLHEHGVAELLNIAIGYDAGPESERALELADAIAVAADAELLIHSVSRDPAPRLLPGDALAPELLQDAREGVQHGALKIGQGAAARTAATSYVNASVGDPGAVLRELSADVDLMVVGSRRWGPLARVVLGGVGEALAGDCGASLIITGPPAEQPHPQRESPHPDGHSTPTSPAAGDGRIVL